MIYEVELKPGAIKDLQSLPRDATKQLLLKIEALENDLVGDVKRLTNFTPEYRLRVGRYRVLFEIERDRVVIYRIVHRKEAYR
ncbi:MAG: type II toxin-antitoxin system RelE/ParE family toxin [SAR324 cluster bacterium]|nr:type II toxin-antitoxin system RelE/ParE family toxin [SAR324 cluster bacterium]